MVRPKKVVIRLYTNLFTFFIIIIIIIIYLTASGLSPSGNGYYACT
jgi:phage shock protein PspC (stress-responsive transcriptional regulator)